MSGPAPVEINASIKVLREEIASLRAENAELKLTSTTFIMQLIKAIKQYNAELEKLP